MIALIDFAYAHVYTRMRVRAHMMALGDTLRDALAMDASFHGAHIKGSAHAFPVLGEDGGDYIDALSTLLSFAGMVLPRDSQAWTETSRIHARTLSNIGRAS